MLLTTQYLDEADQLADDIVVIDHGRVIATGTPDELKAKTGAQTLVVRPGGRVDLPSWSPWPSWPASTPEVEGRWSPCRSPIRR